MHNIGGLKKAPHGYDPKGKKGHPLHWHSAATIINACRITIVVIKLIFLLNHGT
jgi:hypothetical protein